MNLANRLTLFRIILVPVFMVFLLNKITYGEYLAAGVFILAALTDSLDGYIARKHNQVTKLGKLMDPIADKLLVTAALISLVQMDKLSAWIAMVIIAREFVVTGIRSIAASEGQVIAASIWGKLKTISQVVAVVAIILNNFPFSYIGIPFDQIAIWTAVALTLISLADYLYKCRKIFINSR
ncbi:MAG: CDP-diacylglycerol--glycerol-3-phosphate 3-phosphatidyltransferase [Clostridiales bacterium]|jgi:CDP-diacylglycerol--glycerol-3-phosphate 3-phosphatidyltransferase|nr:CDP-diacylglycerol--glycerol-3-phosphate 3-phosphatidyltransferase [Clostridiales bacterium]HOC08766.1 CDP-diacylglycerol--glycerol-3-phosphate 3-phosphatidyltransferase [Bacillota bacterium]HQA47315.1 CDP-diacylglycerol--glycerol-3-phosphate 3-phosphatidyltransferase [Bacillota bacterium]HQD41165.1 CDP-diacylglycerol--glycerol-3-phosphate 3-phosphatidyltransferase [Bacillota bacterium]